MSLKRLQTMQKKLRRNSTGNLRKVGLVALVLQINVGGQAEVLRGSVAYPQRPV
jgi:hypothetical protein